VRGLPHCSRAAHGAAERKMETGTLQVSVEDVLEKVVWPSRWPYGKEDFRPFDYTCDEVLNTGAQYIYSQSLIQSMVVQIIPALLRVPIYILPKDKLALRDHFNYYFGRYKGVDARDEDPWVLELSTCYDSICPPWNWGPRWAWVGRQGEGMQRGLG